MKSLIWLPIAGFLLIAGAAVATAAPTILDAAKGVVAAASPAPSGDTTGVTTDGPHFGFADDLLQSVLADLVTKGTITHAQSDAITQGLQDELTQRQTDAEARRTLIEGFIADGVITQDEVNQLPADDPLRVAFDSIANDGQISLDQLRNLGPFGGPGGPGGHRGPHGGFFVWGFGDGDSDNPANAAPSASPSASSTSS